MNAKQRRNAKRLPRQAEFKAKLKAGPAKLFVARDAAADEAKIRKLMDITDVCQAYLVGLRR